MSVSMEIYLIEVSETSHAAWNYNKQMLDTEFFEVQKQLFENDLKKLLFLQLLRSKTALYVS